MDIPTGLTTVGTAWAVLNSELAKKLLGPSFDLYGEKLKEWNDRRLKNVSNIIQAMAKRLGSKAESEGAVPPRVLKTVITEGSYSDDPLTAEYYGGVLASSRSGVSRDDRGATFMATLADLSTYQIRSHYIFYRLFRQFFAGIQLQTLYPPANISGGLCIYLPYEVYAAAMDLQEGEDVRVIAAHSLHGLSRHDLIEGLAYGEPASLKNYLLHYLEVDQIAKPGLVVGMSVFGTELYHWVHGKSDFRSQNDYLDPRVSYESIIDVQIPVGALQMTPRRFD